MNVYIFLALYILFVSVVFQKKNLLFILTFVPLLLFFGTRVGMGVDYDTYMAKYELQHDWDLARYLLSAAGGKNEPGFFLLLKLLPSFNALIFLCSALILVPVAIFFYEFISKGYYPLAFVLYLFTPRIFESFIAMRSGVVVGLFLLAVVLKYRGYIKTSIAIVTLSGLFHMSGFLLIPVFLISGNFLKKHFIFASSIIIVLMFLALLLPTFWGEIFVQMSNSIDEFSDYREQVTNTNYGLGFYLFSIARAGFVIYILSLLKKGVIEDKYIWIAWVTIFGYFFNMVQGIETIYRFVYYFYLVTIPFKCYVLRVDKSEYSKIYVGLSILYLLYSFIGYTQLDQTQQFIWDYKSYLF